MVFVAFLKVTLFWLEHLFQMLILSYRMLSWIDGHTCHLCVVYVLSAKWQDPQQVLKKNTKKHKNKTNKHKQTKKQKKNKEVTRCGSVQIGGIAGLISYSFGPKHNQCLLACLSASKMLKSEAVTVKDFCGSKVFFFSVSVVAFFFISVNANFFYRVLNSQSNIFLMAQSSFSHESKILLARYSSSLSGRWEKPQGPCKIRWLLCSSLGANCSLWHCFFCGFNIFLILRIFLYFLLPLSIFCHFCATKFCVKNWHWQSFVIQDFN